MTENGSMLPKWLWTMHSMIRHRTRVEASVYPCVFFGYRFGYAHRCECGYYWLEGSK